MSDAQQTIAAVLVNHGSVERDGGFVGCICGDPADLLTITEHAAHQAAEVDAALGTLTRQWSVTEKWEGRSNATFSDPEDADNFAASIVSNFWCKFADVSGAATAEPRPVVERRWVSGWTPQDGDTRGEA